MRIFWKNIFIWHHTVERKNIFLKLVAQHSQDGNQKKLFLVRSYQTMEFDTWIRCVIY